MPAQNHNKVRLSGTRWSLERTRDGMGDSGPMFLALDPKKKLKKPAVVQEELAVGKSGEIRVGCAVLCGSYMARSFQRQDWWRTSLVTKITRVVYEGKKVIEVRFKTNKSEYIARSI